MITNKTNGKNIEIYSLMTLSLNVLMAIAFIMILVEAIVPLLGGKPSVRSLMLYASWIGIAVVVKGVLKRSQKGLGGNKYDYATLCLCGVLNLMVWVSYPINIFCSALCVILIVIAYLRNGRKRN